MEFCEDCEYLKPKDCNPIIEREKHMCTLSNKQVFHSGYHPKIVPSYFLDQA